MGRTVARFRLTPAFVPSALSPLYYFQCFKHLGPSWNLIPCWAILDLFRPFQTILNIWDNIGPFQTMQDISDHFRPFPDNFSWAFQTISWPSWTISWQFSDIFWLILTFPDHFLTILTISGMAKSLLNILEQIGTLKPKCWLDGMELDWSISEPLGLSEHRLGGAKKFSTLFSVANMFDGSIFCWCWCTTPWHSWSQFCFPSTGIWICSPCELRTSCRFGGCKDWWLVPTDSLIPSSIVSSPLVDCGCCRGISTEGWERCWRILPGRRLRQQSGKIWRKFWGSFCTAIRKPRLERMKIVGLATNLVIVEITLLMMKINDMCDKCDRYMTVEKD